MTTNAPNLGLQAAVRAWALPTDWRSSISIGSDLRLQELRPPDAAEAVDGLNAQPGPSGRSNMEYRQLNAFLLEQRMN